MINDKNILQSYVVSKNETKYPDNGIQGNFWYRKIKPEPLPPLGTALSMCSWAEIDTISQAGLASEYWSIGDEIHIIVNGEAITMQIYDFDHDTLSSDGVSKAGITFGTKHLMMTKRQMNSTNTNVGGWDSCAMRAWITGTFIGQIPSDLQTVLKTVNKLTSAGNKSATINTTEDEVFLFSEVECFGSNPTSKAGEGSKYAIFTDNASRIKKLSNGLGSAEIWFERSPHGSYNDTFSAVSNAGGTSNPSPSAAFGVAFGFCV